MTHINSPSENVTIFDQGDLAEATSANDKPAGEVYHYHTFDDYPYKGSPRRVDRIVWLVGITLELFIAFRVFLKLIAANPASGFAGFVYAITEPFLLPFAGLTSTPSANGAVLEISSFIAMIVYAILIALSLYAFHILSER